ncbi:DUF2868 domain-containing protein [Eoetvoesiella caeni]|uniref:DUF2868 domain-containing protein n=1 Tax=Eoetvoesiella caeni TaxID=645616 RepID=UPI001C55622F|nr:DUF2868 domain-containing protein [Eoetvoesiella caeni]
MISSARRAHTPSISNGSSFNSYWTAEFVRLREAHWGPLEDSREVRQARTQGTGFTQKVLLRAALLAKREGIEDTLGHWRRIARLTLVAMLLVTLLAGAAASQGALGDGSRPVNLLLALAALLGLHAITFVLWLFSFALQGRHAGTWLGQAWLWLTKKLARGPDSALAPRALSGLLDRNGSLRWVLAATSHGLWTVALLSAITGLVALLSARRYGFNWETTLLSADTFVSMTQALGWLPGLLGFTMPDETIVRLSNGLHVLPESAQTLWSSWLLGCVVVYGLIPRLACFALCFVIARRKIAATTLDTSLPGYADLRERLQPSSEKMGVDAPAGDDYQASIRKHGAPGLKDGQTGQCLAAGLELPADLPWPPRPLLPPAHDLGLIDTGAQRKSLLDLLFTHPPRKLLIACDRRQTPDRGAIGFIAEAAGHSAGTRILLLPPGGEHTDPRSAAWVQRLVTAGIAASDIHTDPTTAIAWLTMDGTHD